MYICTYVYMYICIYVRTYHTVLRTVRYCDIPQKDLFEGVLTVLIRGLDCDAAPSMAVGEHLPL